MANNIRDLQFQSGDPGAILATGRSQSQDIAEQTPVQRFNNALFQLLQQQQQLGTRPFVEQELGGRQAQLEAGRSALPETLRTADPRLKLGVLGARQQAFEPVISGAQQAQQTFGEQIKSLGSVLESTRSFLADEEQRQQNVKQNMRNQILDAATIGGSQGLQALLNTPEGKQAFKISGFDSDTLIASVKAKEVEDRRRFDVQQATSTATLKALKETQEKRDQEQKVLTEASGIINLARGLLGSDLGGITGKERIKGFIPGTISRTQKAQALELINKLSLGEREKLKGQGTVSDFEGKMLGKAATALTFDLSEEAFKQELSKIMGVFQTAAGGVASVRVVSPDRRVKKGQLSRDQINDAILKGFQVEYTGQ